MGQKQHIHELNAKNEKLVYAANLSIKLLRSRLGKSGHETSSAGMVDGKAQAVLAAVEQSVAMLPEAEKWRVGCEALRLELQLLKSPDEVSLRRELEADLKLSDYAKDPVAFDVSRPPPPSPPPPLPRTPPAISAADTIKQYHEIGPRRPPPTHPFKHVPHCPGADAGRGSASTGQGADRRLGAH
jgi:hypothetical protein